MVEHWGVYEELRYARGLGFHAIELNVDSLVVVSPMGQSLVAKILHLLDLEWEVVVNHSYREAN
jgi:hypothetical protein